MERFNACPFMSAKVSYDEVQWRTRALHDLKPGKAKTVFGFDTETLHGYARLITDSNGRNLLVRDLHSLFRFLSNRRYRASFNFFYNIKFDFQAIIKALPHKLLKLLYSKGKLTVRDFLLYRVFNGFPDDDSYWLLKEKWQIRYIEKKLFSLTKNRHVTRFFDIAQFFGGSLDYNAETYLAAEKNPEGLDREQIGTNHLYWLHNLQKIIDYCILDSKLCQRLGEHLQDVLNERLDIYPHGYLSKASVSKDYFRSRCTIPDVRKIPMGVLGMALNAYVGGRFEVIRRGTTPSAVSIDLNSAYPKCLRDLPDCTTGRWSDVWEYVPDALLGFYLVRFFIPITHIGPLPFRPSPERITYPVGEMVTTVTHSEYTAVMNDVDSEVISGVVYHDPTPSYPFRVAVDALYNVKRETPKKDFKYSLVKILLNSFYGSMYEKIKRGEMYWPGKLFNPVYASEVTAETRADLWGIIRNYQKHVLMLATDGIVLDKMPRVDFSDNMGEWAVEAEGNCTILKSGIYKIDDKVKNRGIQSVERLKTPYGAFGSIFDYIQAVPYLTEYRIDRYRPLGFGECVVHSLKHDLEDMNVFVDDPQVIDINTDYKRLWDTEFQCGGSIFRKSIDSQPLLYGYNGVF